MLYFTSGRALLGVPLDTGFGEPDALNRAICHIKYGEERCVGCLKYKKSKSCLFLYVSCINKKKGRNRL